MDLDEMKTTLKRLLKKSSIITIIILSIIVFLVSVWYLICYDESKTTKIASKEYSSTVRIDTEKGIYSTLEEDDDDEDDIPADEVEPEDNEEKKYQSEILQFFEDRGYDVERYFDDEDEEVNLRNFKHLLNAELVTQFPYIQGLSRDKVNGVIRFKRISVKDQQDYSSFDTNNIDWKEGTLTYVDKDTFDTMITEFNSDNSQTDLKNEIMNSFTITGENNDIVEVAILKEAKVVTNDEYYLVKEAGDPDFFKDIKSELGEYFQNASYTISQDEETGDRIFTFQILSTIQIDYKNLIEKYTMPIDFLFNLLTYSEDLEFVKSVADLAYNSKIIIGIYDDISSEITYSKEYEYNRQEKTEIIANTYIPRVLAGYTDEDLAVNSNFEIFKNDILNYYSTINIMNLTPQYGEYYNTEINNIHHISSGAVINGESAGYYDEITYMYEYLVDEEGKPATDTLPKEYHLNYYFYENTPKCDLNIADIWYGYYSNNCYYNEIEINKDDPQPVAPSEYQIIKINTNQGEEQQFKNNIISKFSTSVDTYVDSGAFDTYFEDSFVYVPFSVDTSKITEEMTEEEKQAEKIRQRNEWSRARDRALRSHILSQRGYKKNELKNRLNSSTSFNITNNTYIRDTNILMTTYNISLSETEEFFSTLVATENTYFSSILQQYTKAYNALDDIGHWFIAALQENESTKNVVQKVQYLLNQAYETESFGKMEGNELFELYTPDIVETYIPESGSFLQIAKECHEYLREYNYFYSSQANKVAGNYVKDGTSTGRIVPIEIGEPQRNRYIDCSAYVTWVLMQTGHISSSSRWQYTSYDLYANSWGFGTMSVLGVEGLTSADLASNGYILVKKGHTEIYAGKDANGYYYTYNAGSTSAIRKEISKYTQSQFYEHFNSDYKILIVGES